MATDTSLVLILRDTTKDEPTTSTQWICIKQERTIRQRDTRQKPVASTGWSLIENLALITCTLE